MHIVSGLGFSGNDKDGNPQWLRCRNVDPLMVEWPENPRSVSTGWNSRVNVWLKRCAFLFTNVPPAWPLIGVCVCVCVCVSARL